MSGDPEDTIDAGVDRAPARSASPSVSLASEDPMDATVVERPAVDRAAAVAPSRVQRGDAIGRYLVLDRLGAGAMGEVLAAYDPDLDRKIAIKLIKPRGWSSDVARMRLQREAQALAKLRHPNVIVVHDVGLQGERLFVAMEHVEGLTLGKWMAEADPPRSSREVLEVFVAAGRGLAAAHAAGIVHRDFKPDNVMLASDGRVLVLDFGLARTSEQEEAPRVESSKDELVALSTPTTQAGTLVGTPAYMAPEQFEGRADARSDQFAFCVALYEALHGQRPFAGENAFELCAAVTGGELRDPPRDTRVPAWLHRVVVRGLATAPEQRWPGLDELLAALLDDPAVQRRRWLGAGAMLGAVAVGAVGIGLFVDGRAETERCTGAAARLAGVWDQDARTRLRDGLMGTDVAYAESTWTRVEARVDASTAAWVEARNEACRATQIAEQSAELLDLRMHCYDRWLEGLSAQLDVLAQADGTVAREAASAVASLESLDACADGEALRNEHPLPADPEARAGIDGALRGLDRALALERAGKLPEAASAAAAVVGEAERLEYPPLLARAMRVQGGALVGTGQTLEGITVLERGYELALGSKLLDEAALTAGLIVGVASARLGDDARAEQWVPHARALGQASDEARVQAAVIGNLGTHATLRGDLPEAKQLSARALTLSLAALGPDHPFTALCITNIGNLAVRSHEPAEAAASFRHALEIMERTHGPDHPNLISTLSNLSRALGQLHEEAEGRRVAERALALAERTVGVDPHLIANVLSNLALLSRDPPTRRDYFERALALLGSSAGDRALSRIAVLHHLAGTEWQDVDYDAARTRWEEALRLLEAGGRSDAVNEGEVLQKLGNVARIQARHEDALDLYTRALGWQTTHPEVDPKELATTLNNLGITLQVLGQYEGARRRHAEALAIREKVLAPDHKHMSYSQTGLGLALVDLGRVDEAIPLLERALELRTSQAADAPLVAETRFGLARALWSRGAIADRERARELATAARDGYAGDEARFAPDAAQIDTWLRETALGARPSPAAATNGG